MIQTSIVSAMTPGLTLTPCFFATFNNPEPLNEEATEVTDPRELQRMMRQKD